MKFKYYFLLTNYKIKCYLVGINKDTNEICFILKLNESKTIKP